MQASRQLLPPRCGWQCRREGRESSLFFWPRHLLRLCAIALALRVGLAFAAAHVLLRLAFGRQIDADVQFLELFRTDGVWGIHQEILGVLVHWKHDHFANIAFVREQHDDAIDAWSDSTVRRRSKF